MNCAEWEERVALYAGGDLDAQEAAGVEKHLGECAGCQMFASGMRQSLETLREAHAELPEAASFAAVRAWVMARVGPRRRWQWLYALAAPVVLALLMVAVWVERHPIPPEPPAAVRLPSAPAEAFVIPTRTPPRVRPEELAQGKREPVMIRLVTDNPDVVIYWIAETKGF